MKNYLITLKTLLATLLIAVAFFMPLASAYDFTAAPTDYSNESDNLAATFNRLATQTPQIGATSNQSTDTSASISGIGAVSGAPDVSMMLTSIAGTVPMLMRLVTGFAYIIGMFLISKAVVEFKHMGEMRNMMMREASVKGPLLLMLIGAALLFLPTSIQTGISTFFTEGQNPYGYEDLGSSPWCQTIKDSFMIVQLVGVIAFIRGLITLARAGMHHQGQPGTLAKGFTYVIAGILCIDLWDLLVVAQKTFGLNPVAC